MLTEGLISNLFQCNLRLDLKNSQSRVFIIQTFRFSEIINRVTKLVIVMLWNKVPGFKKELLNKMNINLDYISITSNT